MYVKSVFLIFLENQRALEAGNSGFDLADLRLSAGLQMAKSHLSTTTIHVWNTTHTNTTHTDQHQATRWSTVLSH